MQTSQGPVDRGIHPLQWQRESDRETTFKYGVYLQTVTVCMMFFYLPFETHVIS